MNFELCKICCRTRGRLKEVRVDQFGGYATFGFSSADNYACLCLFNIKDFSFPDFFMKKHKKLFQDKRGFNIDFNKQSGMNEVSMLLKEVPFELVKFVFFSSSFMCTFHLEHQLYDWNKKK